MYNDERSSVGMHTSTLQRQVIVNNYIVELINLTLERQSMHSHAPASLPLSFRVEANVFSLKKR